MCDALNIENEDTRFSTLREFKIALEANNEALENYIVHHLSQDDACYKDFEWFTEKFDTFFVELEVFFEEYNKKHPGQESANHQQQTIEAAKIIKYPQKQVEFTGSSLPADRMPAERRRSSGLAIIAAMQKVQQRQNSKSPLCSAERLEELTAPHSDSESMSAEQVSALVRKSLSTAPGRPAPPPPSVSAHGSSEQGISRSAPVAGVRRKRVTFSGAAATNRLYTDESLSYTDEGAPIQAVSASDRIPAVQDGAAVSSSSAGTSNPSEASNGGETGSQALSSDAFPFANAASSDEAAEPAPKKARIADGEDADRLVKFRQALLARKAKALQRISAAQEVIDLSKEVVSLEREANSPTSGR